MSDRQKGREQKILRQIATDRKTVCDRQKDSEQQKERQRDSQKDRKQQTERGGGQKDKAKQFKSCSILLGSQAGRLVFFYTNIQHFFHLPNVCSSFPYNICICRFQVKNSAPGYMYVNNERNILFKSQILSIYILHFKCAKDQRNPPLKVQPPNKKHAARSLVSSLSKQFLVNIFLCLVSYIYCQNYNVYKRREGFFKI